MKNNKCYLCKKNNCTCHDYYPITSICKDDLLTAGYTKKQINKLDSSDMIRLASKMADSYLDNSFWIDLPIVADYLLEEK